jgi:hypothetical protein
VNPGDNPWSFTALSPALNVVAGSQYSFYVGISYGDEDEGGDGGD